MHKKALRWSKEIEEILLDMNVPEEDFPQIKSVFKEIKLQLNVKDKKTGT